MAKFDKGTDFNFGANVKPKATPKPKGKKGKRPPLSRLQRETARFYIGRKR